MREAAMKTSGRIIWCIAPAAITILAAVLPRALADESSKAIQTPSTENRPHRIASLVAKDGVPAAPADNGGKLPRRHAARTEQAAKDARQPTRADSVAKSVATWWPLLVVLCTIAIIATVGRRWLPKMQQLGLAGGIRVISRFYLSGKQSLCLIRLGRRVVLLGVTPENIQTLVNVDDPEEVAHLTSSLEQSRPGSFSRAFSGFMKTAESVRQDPSDVEEPAAVEKRAARTSTRITASVDRLRKIMAGTSAEST